MEIIYLNGMFLPKTEATVSVLDRGFLFSDGVYEVIPVYDGKPMGLIEHLERLEISAKAIHMTPPLSITEWKKVLKELMLKNNLEGDFSFYLQITRGSAPERTHHFPEKVSPTIMALCKPLDKKSQEEINRGLKAITCEDKRRSNCYVKATNLLPNILCYQQAKEAGAVEAILIRNDHAIEATSSNLFIVKNSTLITTPLSNQILAGITRQFVIQLIEENGFAVEERLIKKEELFEADEVWLTASNKEIYPITQIDNQFINHGKVGPIWKKVIALYQERKKLNEPF